MRIFYFVIALLLCCSFSPPEGPAPGRLRYSVLKDGKEIGKIVASRTVQGQKVVYLVQTDMNVKLILTQKVNYTSRSVYEQGRLIHSVAQSYVNGRLHQSCTTTFANNSYQIETNKGNWNHGRPIQYSGTLLYFREPGQIVQVFSEMSGQNNTVKRTSDHAYVLTDSRSKKQNKYLYKSGILEHATINHTLLDLEIQRIN